MLKQKTKDVRSYFENGIGKETEILVETNFISFVIYFNIQKMLLLVIFLAIKLLSQVIIFKHRVISIFERRLCLILGLPPYLGLLAISTLVSKRSRKCY